MGKGEGKRNMKSALEQSKDQDDKEKEPRVKLFFKKSLNMDGGSLIRGDQGMMKDENHYPSEKDKEGTNKSSKGRFGKEKVARGKSRFRRHSSAYQEEEDLKFGKGNLSGDEATYHTSAPLSTAAPIKYDLPQDTASGHREKLPKGLNLHSLSTSSSEMRGSDSGNVPLIPTTFLQKTSPMIHRNPKQDAMLDELVQRKFRSKLVSDDATTPEAESPEVAAPQMSPEIYPTAEYSTKKFLWLRIENIPVTEQIHSTALKNNDIVRWLDFDAKYLESKPPPLPAGTYLDCEAWSGELVVVPSEHARLITSSCEVAELLKQKPRAQIIEDFVGTSDEDLSVVTGEVIYLLHECGNTHFMAMNKSIRRGRVPKRVLNVLVAL
ncbi:hypothetical protein TcWFU_003764 [Taenia crassiceps]|uniref:SH3 domain-containing protein n=1 Tax=Taenia crassiceps TaxID=6207 RepID=A0ABR4Q260_9CEST